MLLALDADILHNTNDNNIPWPQADVRCYKLAYLPRNVHVAFERNSI